jgi:hypothetical protein
MKNQLLFFLIFLTTPVFAQEKPDSLVFSEAVEMAQAMLDSMEMDAIILGGETFYGMGNGDGEGKEEDDYKEEDRLFFGDMNRGPSIVMGEHEGDSTGENSAMGRMVPDGYAYMWNVLAYDSSVDSVVIMYVDAEGVFDGYMLGTDEADEEIDFSIMKPLPESYIDSDSAMVIASEMGGDRFLDYYSSKEGREYSEWEVDLYAIHEYWALPDVIAADVPVMWVARYFGISKDMEGWTEMAEYSVYMDMTTGDTLFTEWYYPEEEPYEPQGIVFSEAVEMAQAMLDSMEMDAIILGGETFYGMGNGDGEGKEEDDYKEEDRLFFGDMNRGPSIVMGEHEGDSTGENSAMGRMVPDGYAYMWNVLAYDSSVDSVIVISVGVDGVIYFESFGEDESDNEVDFSIMKPLPQVYMDSNELFETIFQQATFNGEDIVNMILPEIPSGSNLTMDMEVRILHDYWGLPVDLAPELIPVTWHMNMYATAMDSMGYVVMEDSLSMFMDAGTGELLYASKELTNIEEEFNLPLVTTLHQNYPNPFNPTTSISFELNKAQNVSLIVYNLLGQRVLTLVNDRLESGKHRINLNASNLASGIYMYRLTTNSQSLTKKMTLIK